MPTRTIALKATEPTTDISRSSNRVPLEALQMLTQSVSKCNQDYIQPLTFKVLLQMSAKYFEISRRGFIVIKLCEAIPLVKLTLIFTSNRLTQAALFIFSL